jgi:hypothetical protein
VVDKASDKIICLAHGKGRCHDFRLFRESNVRLHPGTQAIIDNGYLGLQKRHANTSMPKKRRKKQPLTKEDKCQNRIIAQKRVRIENVIACLKRFKIISDRYRNRRKRFGLRFTLIAALYNKELNV